MTTVDIEAIRERAQKFDDLGTELSPSNYRIIAIAARSAGDVPALLAVFDAVVADCDALREEAKTLRATNRLLSRELDSANAEVNVLWSTEDGEAVVLQAELEQARATIRAMVGGER